MAPSQVVREVVVKNTFLDFDLSMPSSVGPQSQSCPVEAFSPSYAYADDGSSLADSLAGMSEMRMCDLAAAARMFSNVKFSRTEMESSGNVASRGDHDNHANVLAERTWGSDSLASMDFQDAASMMGGSAPQIRPPPP